MQDHDSPITPKVVLPKIFIAGHPEAQGSMKSFVNRVTGKPIVVHNKGKELKKWRETLLSEVRISADRSLTLLSYGGYIVTAAFILKRPMYHYGKGVIKPQFMHAQHRTTPDVDKLARAVLDALTGHIWTDDSNVIGFSELIKVYGEHEGMILGIGHISEKENVTEAGIII